MSAVPRRAAAPPQTDRLIETAAIPRKELESRRQQAEQARRHASAIGDYAAAESWYRQGRALDAQIAGQRTTETGA